MPTGDQVAGGQLRAFVERIERLEEELKAVNDDKKDVYAEAKGNGFDVKILKKVVAARRKQPHEREEEDMLFDLYWSALQGAEMSASVKRADIDG